MSEVNHTRRLENRVSALMRKERLLEAIALLRDEHSLVEQDWRLSWNLGWCYFSLNRFFQAQRVFARALERFPGNSACNWGLGLAYLKRKRFNKAENHLAESLRVKDFYPARIALAFAYLSQGKIDEAENTHLAEIERRHESRRYESYAAFLSDVGREKEASEMNLKAESLRRREESRPKKSPRRNRSPSRNP
jgi:tetratricopeptide (TPR) repeat protein